MKDFQKRWQPNSTDSVIATLMGFPELRSTQPSHETRRALSESYIHKVASITVRPGSLVSTRRSCSINNEIARNSTGKNENVLDKCVNSSTSSMRTKMRRSNSAGDSSLSKSLSRDRYEDIKSIGEKGKHSATRHVLRRQQKLEHDSLVDQLGELGIDSMSNSLNFPLVRKDRHHLLSTSFSALMIKSEKVAAYKELLVNGNVSPRHSCIACTRNMNRIPPPERCRSKFEEVLKTEYQSYGHDPHLLLDRSPSPYKLRKRNIDSWKSRKEVQESGVSGRKQTPNKILALTDNKSMARNLDTSLGRSGLCSPTSLQLRSCDSSSPSVLSSIYVVDDDCLNGWDLKQDESSARDNTSKVQTTSQKDVLESESRRGREQFRTSLGVDDAVSPRSKVSELSSGNFSCLGSSYHGPEAYVQSIQDQIDNSFKYDSCQEIEHSQINSKSYISREASLNEFSEDDTAYSHSSSMGPPESLENLKRTNQHSPDSVLERYDIKNLPSFKYFDSLGLQLQLEALNFGSEENHSEGSIMAVSGEDDSEEHFVALSDDGRMVEKWLRDEESRNFSYMVDVLDEAGFYGTNSSIDFNTWSSLECPINPSVFRTLEKKYGEQTSWQKPERQLLFDRINSGLLSIFNLIINFQTGATSMRRKFRASFRCAEVEDELWTMLIGQEDAKSIDLSEKALDQWLESDEGISIICQELETSLFDELVIELASL